MSIPLVAFVSLCCYIVGVFSGKRYTMHKLNLDFKHNDALLFLLVKLSLYAKMRRTCPRDKRTKEYIAREDLIRACRAVVNKLKRDAAQEPRPSR